MTRVLRVDRAAPAAGVIDEAASLLRRGGLVAFPTETVYGLGANALDPGAVRSIYLAKGRPAFNPVICHVASVAEARALVACWPARADLVAEAFWPGPVSIVLPRRDHVPDVVTGGGSGVAVRIPSHPVARALIIAAGVPIAAPSANRSNGLSPTLASHVVESLGEAVPLILDGGATTVGLESAVVDLSGPIPRLLRPGTIGRPALERVLGPLGEAVAASGDAPRAAPGMLDRHYSPRADLHLVTALDDAKAEALALRLRPQGPVGVLTSGLRPAWADVVADVPADADGLGRELYAALHRLDAAGCRSIVVAELPDSSEWSAVRDRLRRAAHRPT
jgi:L-threonylcarbamoyladenylate synthase